MTDDQSQGEELEANESTSVASDSPSRKRLFSDPNLNDDSAASSDSFISSDSSSDRIRKKTRDLPNLSDCHSCGVRINYTNPQERLQTLDSVWRIVLLCKKCIRRVKSAKVCSYCFKETADDDCFRCRDCERRVHRDCVVRYASSVPWSYCSSELEFSVCVDCWVPKLLANSNTVGKKMRNKKILSRACSVGDSGVPVDDGPPQSLEDLVNDANSAADKKAAAASEAKENALRKAVVAKRAVELANGALDLIVDKDEIAVKNESALRSNNDSAANNAVLDDAELAFKLHRSMNSSPRISKILCILNSSCSDVQKTCESKGNLTARLSYSKGSPSPTVACNRASDDDFLSNLDCSKPDGLTDERTRTTSKRSGGNGYSGFVGNCSSGDDSGTNSESNSSKKEDGLGQKLHSNNSNTQCELKCNEMLLYARRKKKMRDRFLFKYTKRHVGTKIASNRESKSLTDCFHVESKTTAYGVHVNSSKESRMILDAPSQSCAQPVQASYSGTNSSQDQF